MEEKNKKSFWKLMFLYAKDIVIILLCAVALNTFVFTQSIVIGSSMESSYYNKERIIIDKFSYLLERPTRGDVVVFRPGLYEDKQNFLKRVIAIPGDTVKISGGFVYIKVKGQKDFVQINEPYLDPNNYGKTYSWGKKEAVYKLKYDQYFVLGDNRQGSSDSRHCFGNCNEHTEFISHADIVGKVFMDLGHFDFSSWKFRDMETGAETFPRFFDISTSFDYKL